MNYNVGDIIKCVENYRTMSSIFEKNELCEILFIGSYLVLFTNSKSLIISEMEKYFMNVSYERKLKLEKINEL